MQLGYRWKYRRRHWLLDDSITGVLKIVCVLAPAQLCASVLENPCDCFQIWHEMSIHHESECRNDSICETTWRRVVCLPWFQSFLCPFSSCHEQHFHSWVFKRLKVLVISWKPAANDLLDCCLNRTIRQSCAGFVQDPTRVRNENIFKPWTAPAFTKYWWLTTWDSNIVLWASWCQTTMLIPQGSLTCAARDWIKGWTWVVSVQAQLQGRCKGNST